VPGLEDEFGDVVKKARAGLGIDLGDLAARTGLTESDLRGIEVYTKVPAEPEVRRLAAALQLRPDQLWALAQDSWSAPDVPWAIGEQFTVDRLTNAYPEHCYVVTARSGACLIVDPGEEPDRVIATATQPGRRPVAILVTHGHRDHTGAVVPVQRATGGDVYVHAGDEESVAGVPGAAIRVVRGDMTLRIGDVEVEVLHTPGHTAGSATYVLRDGERLGAFCGDTLFAGSAGNGRYGYTALLDSLRQKLAQLPAAAVLYPGHGPATTVANEHARNPFL
jgi:glyoxylase-like metal-dependent hydrolase (beta-lactamase superfamily II)